MPMALSPLWGPGRRDDPAGRIPSGSTASLWASGLTDPGFGTDREFRASFDHQASASISFLFLGLSPPKANKTVSFLVSFHRGATKSGILFLVSIARATARRIYHCRPWLSDVSPLADA